MYSPRSNRSRTTLRRRSKSPRRRSKSPRRTCRLVCKKRCRRTSKSPRKRSSSPRRRRSRSPFRLTMKSLGF